MSEEAVGRDREESIRRTVVDAWWELDTLGPHGSPEYGSPAWVVERVFIWVADEERSLHWVARELNRMDIPTAGGRRWKPAKVHRLVANPCYTGKHSYNVHARVPTPGQSLADITAKIKRNRKERKPESEWVHFEVPALVSEERGRGPINCSASAAAVEADRGGLSKPCSGVASTAHSVTNLWWSAGTLGTITSTIIAKYTVGNGTQCHAPTLLLFLARGMKSYGLIPAAYYATIAGWTPSFRPWQNKDETLAGSSVQETKMAQMKHQIAKVQEGFEGEIYTLEEAQSRTLQLQVSIKDVEGETERLRRRAGAGPHTEGQLRAAREELARLRDRNMDEASFDERQEIISRLGLRVYPAEDLQTMQIKCRLAMSDFPGSESGGQVSTEKPSGNPHTSASELELGCREVPPAPPTRTSRHPNLEAFLEVTLAHVNSDEEMGHE